MSEKEVVFGAGTPLGAAVVRYLAAEGRAVRAVVSDPTNAIQFLPPRVEIVKGNPLDLAIVESACRDASTIYHCVLVRYHKWKEAAQSVMNNLLGHAIQTGMKFVFADPVYDSASYANNFDEQVLHAQEQGFTQVVVARFPQLYGPAIRNTLFDEVFDAIMANKRAYWIGSLDVPRDFLYIDDAARACAALGISPKAYGRKWDISGGTPITGKQFIELVFKEAGKEPDIGIWRAGLLRLAGILDYDSKEMVQLPYDYSKPMVLNGTDFNVWFPTFEYTPIQVGLRDTLEWYKTFLKPHGLREKYFPLTTLPP
ncbi:MAG: NAD-dependent epimerase/dehydratase family protein [Thaumarchaeota archaeon]|nr:NAD-dependent epimerase/dehydratase family protein [Nitrososphaerota archaeon]